MSTTRPGGAPFMNRLPQSVIDRYEAEQAQAKTAARSATQEYCPETGLNPGEDNSTHHLLPRAKGMTCRYCKKTEEQLRTQHGS